MHIVYIINVYFSNHTIVRQHKNSCNLQKYRFLIAQNNNSELPTRQVRWPVLLNQLLVRRYQFSKILPIIIVNLLHSSNF